MNPRSLDFNEFLAEQLKDPAFRKGYEREHLRSGVAIQIAFLREKIGLTQSALARRLGTTQQALSDIETRKHTNITLETLQKLADALDKRLDIRFS
ncbi:MAG: helix-turn-helix transcriptional regulator [Elusimicrobia bacterium]|nr:helix-turn-helix transcriptional regulator [Elusimicrobiota bacterium]